MKKNKKLLSYEEEKILFDKFSLDTLDSLDLLYDIANEESPVTFSIIFDKKYIEEAENGDFEGRNEYTHRTRIDNFDISEIINKFNELNNNEQKYIMQLINKAIDKIDPDKPEIKIVPKLAECVKLYATTIQNATTVLSCGMTIEEIEKFFKKYNQPELSLFDAILVFNDHQDIEAIRKVKEEIHTAKVREANKVGSFRSPVNNNGLKLTDLKRKNYKLTDKELDFFHDIVDIASGYLESIRLYEGEYQSANEEFSADYYPVEQMMDLLDSIEEEIKNRGYDPINKLK